MNHATRFMRLALSLVLVGALALAGCGGDDNGNVEQDLRDQIAMLEGNVSAAQTAQAAAEAAQATAEQAQMDAEMAQAAAEMERDAANTAKGAADASRDAAVAAQMAAESAQAMAEQAAMDAADAQAAAETAQAVAETERDAATGALSAAQMARDEANDAAAAAMVAQATAVAAQMTAENARDAALADKMAAEEAAAAAAMDAAAKVAMAADAQAAAEEAAAMAAEAQMTAEAAAAASETARMAAVNAQAAAETERDTANTAAAAAETARMAAEQRATDAETARMAAETARDNYKKMAADANAARMEAERQLAIAQGMVDAESAADVAARAKMLSEAMHVLIADEVIQEDDTTDVIEARAVGQVETIDDAPMASGGLELTHTAADGVMVSKVNYDDNQVSFRAYTEAATMPPAIAGWDGLTLERRDEPRAADQTLYVYTDIAAAGDVSFLQKYKSETTPVTNANIGLATSASFPGRTQGEQTITDDLPFAGTFDGVAGTFNCDTTGGCTVTANAGNGSLSVDAGHTFTFTPDDIDDLVESGDGEYLYFGYWLHKPDDPRGMHRFSTFAGGMDMFTLGAGTDTDDTALVEDDTGPALQTLNGQARFQGPAAGKYVTRNLVANTAKIGQFTADAELLADFEETTTSGMITGSVTNFMENGESLGNWSVMLQSTDMDNLLGIDDGNASFMGNTMATIGGANAYGRWNGMFYGNDRKDGRPNAVAGQFDAIAEHAAISGAFGVYNTKAE